MVKISYASNSLFFIEAKHTITQAKAAVQPTAATGYVGEKQTQVAVGTMQCTMSAWLLLTTREIPGVEFQAVCMIITRAKGQIKL